MPGLHHIQVVDRIKMGVGASCCTLPHTEQARAPLCKSIHISQWASMAVDNTNVK